MVDGAAVAAEAVVVDGVVVVAVVAAADAAGALDGAAKSMNDWQQGQKKDDRVLQLIESSTCVRNGLVGKRNTAGDGYREKSIFCFVSYGVTKIYSVIMLFLARIRHVSR